MIFSKSRFLIGDSSDLYLGNISTSIISKVEKVTILEHKSKVRTTIQKHTIRWNDTNPPSTVVEKNSGRMSISSSACGTHNANIVVKPIGSSIKIQ